MLLAFDRLPGAMARYHALMPVEVLDEPRKTCERRLATHTSKTAAPYLALQSKYYLEQLEIGG